MAFVIVIPWASTPWTEAGRLSGRAPVGLSGAGRKEAEAWADGLASSGIRAVYRGPEQAAVESGEIIAERCGVRHRTVPALAELDTGLWAGLTHDELKRRYPKVFKRWWSDPGKAAPPEGESLERARTRLQETLTGLRQRHEGRGFAIVVGPLAFAVVRCIMESVGPEKMRQMVQHEPLRYELAE